MQPHTCICMRAPCRRGHKAHGNPPMCTRPCRDAAPMTPQCCPGRGGRSSRVGREPLVSGGARPPPASTARARQTSNASPASAQTSLSSCEGARRTSHAMLITWICGWRAGMRASTSAIGIPDCSTSLKRHEEGGNPFAKMVAPPSRSHRTCHGVCKQRAGSNP